MTEKKETCNGQTKTDRLQVFSYIEIQFYSFGFVM